MNCFARVVWRELNRIVSRRIYVVAALVIPISSYLLFATVFAEGLPTELPVGVVDGDRSSLSRDFIRQTDAMQMTHIVMHCADFSEAEHEMKKGNIYAFLVIPPNMQSDLLMGRQPKLAFYYNNAYFIPGGLLFKDLSLITSLFSASVGLSTGLAKGKTTEELMGQLQPIVVDAHMIGNPYVNYSVYLSNVLMPGILQLMIVLITVFAIGLELKERTSIEWLRTGNKSIFVALSGKLFPYTVIFTALVIFQNVFLFRLLGFPLHNSLITMITASVLFVLAGQAIGITLIGTLPVLRNALSFASVFGILGISYSGFTFPVEQMPLSVRSLAQLFPMQHFFKIYQDSALIGSPISYYWISYLALLLFLLLPFVVILRLKKAMIFQDYPIK
ncbi:MAG: ABC transporter permease [Candidatus Azobacteroides sp.]|nr:ABC transporter permease [Candidatus Azobacteroides sp.]